MLVDVSAVLAPTSLPRSYGTLIETKRRYDGLERTSVAQQGQYQSYHVGYRPQPIERRPRRGRKGLPTAATAIALFLPAMDVDIIQPMLSSVGTVWVVTELIMWVHRQSPLDASSKLHLKDLPWTHPFSTSFITHHG
jgi:hypothetical protein